MSSKGATSKAGRKIAPKEDIVTRYKTAQKKHNLRDINRSMKKITDLLKSPMAKKNEAKAKKSPKKVKQKIKLPIPIKDIKTEKESDEYYPDKIKRKVENKKVVLKPKHQMKVVAKTDRRKSVPKKDIQMKQNLSKRLSSPVMFAEMTMAEIIQYTEETQELNDEDLMEILTCPSPVWWEDPPDSDYTEDAIPRELYSEILDHEYIVKNIKKEKEDPTEKKPDNPHMEIIKPKSRRARKITKPKEKEVNNIDLFKEQIPKCAVKNTDQNFVKKSKKLEDVLFNIKNKNGVAETSQTIKKIKNKRAKRNSNGRRKIENIVEKANKELVNREKDFATVELTEMNVFTILNEVNIEKDGPKNVEDNFSESDKDIHTKDPAKDFNVPEKLPTLIKKPVLESTATLKTVSEEMDSSSVSSQNIDTISDTNIRFLTDDDDFSDKNESGQNNDEKTVFSPKSTVFGYHKENFDEVRSEKKDCVTVYKVMNSDDEKTKEALERQEINDKIITQLNNFYKKCKNANRRRAKTMDCSQKLEEIDTNKKDFNGFDIKDENDFFCVSC